MGLFSAGLLIYLKGNSVRVPGLIIWVLWYWVLFGFLGFIVTKIDDFPTAFWIIQLSSLLLGVVYILLAPRTLNWWDSNEISVVFLTAETFLCWGIFGMSLVYGLLVKQAVVFLPYILLGTIPFLLPLLLLKSHQSLNSIPAKRYKRWRYPEGTPVPLLEPADPIEVIMRFTRLPDEPSSMDELKPVQFPSKKPLGVLFHYFVNFYNTKMNKGKINYSNRGQMFEWEFYRLKMPNQREYLDADKSLIENQIQPNDIIYAESFTS